MTPKDPARVSYTFSDANRVSSPFKKIGPLSQSSKS